MKIYVVLYGHDGSFEGAFYTKEEAQAFIDREFPDEYWPYISEYEMGTNHVECALNRAIGEGLKNAKITKICDL